MAVRDKRGRELLFLFCSFFLSSLPGGGRHRMSPSRRKASSFALHHGPQPHTERTGRLLPHCG